MGLAQAPENFRHITVEDGLPGNTVYRVKQFSDHFIWLATDAGLARYDGQQFKVYSRRHGLGDQDVLNVYEDSKGNVYCITFAYDLLKLEDGEFRQVIPGDVTVPIRHFYEDDHSNIWLSIGYYDTDGYVLERHKTSFIVRRYPAKYAGPEDSRGRMIFADKMRRIGKLLTPIYNSEDNSLINIERDEIQWITLPDSLFSAYNSVPGRFRKQDGTTIIFSSRYLCEYFDSTFNVVVKLPSEVKRVNSLYEDNASNLYISTNEGLFVFDNQYRQVQPPLFKERQVSQAYRDHEGNLWIATLDDGVFLQNSMARHIEMAKPFSSPQTGITAITSDSRGNVYGVNEDGVFCQVNGEQKYCFEFKLPFPKQRINDFTITSNGQLFLAGGGVVLPAWSPVTGKQISLPKYPEEDERIVEIPISIIINGRPVQSKALYFKTEYVRDVEKQENRILVVGTGGPHEIIYTGSSVSMLNDLTKHNSKFPPATKSVDINETALSICSTTGGVFVSTKRHLMPPKDHWSKRFSNFPFYNCRINDIEEGRDGRVWLATDGFGLVGMHETESLIMINSDDGLSNDGCKRICLQGDDTLWVATPSGLCRVIPGENRTRKAEIAVLKKVHGLPSLQITDMHYQNGQLFVSTRQGLAVIDAINLSADSISPELYITEIHINQEEFDLKNSYNLKHFQNNIKIEMSAINYSSPTMYYYKLDERNPTWFTTQTPQIEFIDLSPGDYDLEIKAQDQTGNFSKENIHIHFNIVPPLWKQPWLRVTLIAMLVILVGGVLIARVRQFTMAVV